MTTNLILRYFSLLVFLTSSFYVTNAQVIFEITSPASISGSYEIGVADFGGDLPGCNVNDNINAGIILMDDMDDVDGTTTDACQATTQDMSNMIALIDRGLCDYDLKASHAEDAGAILAVICNDVPGEGPLGMTAGDPGVPVSIPVISLSYEDCVTIKVEVATASAFLYYNVPPAGSDVVLWDGGQFNGGLGNWTTVGISTDTSVWAWDSDGINNGQFSGSRTLDSPSACNGVMIFNSELYNADVTSQPYPVNTGELISPSIDCSSFSSLSLKFQQFHIPLNGDATWAYSLDGGVVWSEDVIIPTENVLTAVENNVVGKEVHRFLLPEVAGEPNVRFKFTFSGDFYFMMIDDIQLIEPIAFDLGLTDWHAIAPTAQTPVSQLHEFGFIADVYNGGGLEQENVNLNITITDDNSTDVVYSDDLNYSVIASDSLAENIVFGGFTPPADVITSYTGTYTLSSDNVDANQSDNVKTFNFEVTDTVYAKETGATRSLQPALANWDEGEPHSWGMGNYFYITNGSGFQASSVTFTLYNANQLTGESLNIWLYRWIDDDANGIVDIPLTSTERLPVGTFNFVVPAVGNPIQTYTVELNNIIAAGEPLELFDNTGYIAMVDFTTETDKDMILGASEDFDYSAAVWRTESTDNNGGGVGPANYSPVLGIGSINDIELTTTAFGRDIVPVVRLGITPIPVVGVEELAPENVMEVYPVPAKDNITVDVDLTNVSPEAEIKIMDANGKIMLSQTFNNVQKEQFTFDVSDYSAGNYFIHFITDKGARSKYFVVIK